jgi:poly-gamma-glutamate capsule biosynthesis protein CapA/YwtB (metallophosphatase superfamily)
MSITVALAGDTMLGRSVAERLRSARPEELFAAEAIEAVGEADLFVLNRECCIAEGGSPWPDPEKPFFFRAPPVAAELLAALGVDCATLANNHVLDFGREALLETIHLLRRAGVAPVGGGGDVEAARAPAVLEADGFRLGVVAFADHPAEFAAGRSQPGIAYADLVGGRVPDWTRKAIERPDVDAVLVAPHWGPRMRASPSPRIRAAASALVRAGATLIAGHSSHVFQGVDGRVLYDLGDFIDDYAGDTQLRNDLGLLFLVTLDAAGPHRIEAIPLALDYCLTRTADPRESEWIIRRLEQACAPFGTSVDVANGRLLLTGRQPTAGEPFSDP